MDEILNQIRAERARQDAKWGGPEHDAAHDIFDWYIFIAEHAAKAFRAWGVSAEYHQRMIEVAALAVAAIETHDRRTQDTTETGVHPTVALSTYPLAGGNRYRGTGECEQCHTRIDLDAYTNDDEDEFACPNCGRRYVINIVHTIRLIPIEAE